MSRNVPSKGKRCVTSEKTSATETKGLFIWARLTKLARLPGWILPWVHMRNSSPVSEMRKGQRSWGRALVPNSRLDWLKRDCTQSSHPDFGFWNRTRNPGNGFHPREIRRHRGLQLRKLKTDFMDYLGKSILVSSRVFFLLIMRARARPLFIYNCFSNPFSDLPKKTERKGIQEQVFQRWNPFSDFAFDCKSEIQWTFS